MLFECECWCTMVWLRNVVLVEMYFVSVELKLRHPRENGAFVYNCYF